MPQAKIQINGVAGSNENLPINTLVQLNNVNVGGETSYTWELIDQPSGPTDNLSATNIQNPTFTPRKEGSYLIRLIVNLGDATEQQDTQEGAILQLKTGLRIPAAGETTEADTARGWATANNNYLLAMDELLSDPGHVVGLNDSGSTIAAGTICQCLSNPTIKTGLPGQEIVPGFFPASASATATAGGLMMVLVSNIAGGGSVANQGLGIWRYIGRYPSAPVSAAAGTPVYLANSGAISLSAGTIFRQVGTVMGPGSVGGTSDIWFDGVGGFEITPINAPYVIFGAPGTLTNAVRTDGTNATGLTGPFRLKAGSGSVTPFQLQSHAGQSVNIFELLDSGGSVIGNIGSGGALNMPGLFSTTIVHSDGNVDAGGSFTTDDELIFNSRLNVKQWIGQSVLAAMTTLQPVTFANTPLYATSTGFDTGNGVCLVWSDGSADQVSYSAVNGPNGSATGTLNFSGDGILGMASNFADKLVAVGSGGKISSSVDGQAWTARTSGIGGSIFGVVYAASFGAPKWLAFGDGSVHTTVLTSSDGDTWAHSENTAFGTTSGDFAVIQGGGIAVVFANSSSATYYTTSDGITFASHTAPDSIFSVTYNAGNGLFVFLLEDGTVYSSANAVALTLRYTFPAGSLDGGKTFSFGRLSVAFGSSDFNSGFGEVAYTLDGVTWAASQFTIGGAAATDNITITAVLENGSALFRNATPDVFLSNACAAP